MQVHFIGAALSFALSTGRTLVLNGSATWWYLADPWEEHFLPLSTCRLEDLPADLEARFARRRFRFAPPRPARAAARPRGRGQVLPLRGAGDGRGAVAVDDASFHAHLYGRPALDWIPRLASARGLAWWRAQLVAYVARPSARTRAVLDASLARIGLPARAAPPGPGPAVGARDWDQARAAVARFVEEAAALAARLGARREAAALLEQRGLRAVYDPLEERGLHAAARPAEGAANRLANATAALHAALSAAWSLAACQGLVLAVGSDLGKLGLELALASGSLRRLPQSFAPAFVSVDRHASWVAEP
eukprot:tig00000769_g4003.t1